MTSPIPQYGDQPVIPQHVQTDPSAKCHGTKCQHPSIILQQKRLTSTQAKKVQAVITDCWQQLTEGNISAEEVLERCT